MAFNITQFRGEMKGDGARPNLFECRLTFPSLPGMPADAQQTYTFMARAAQLPGTIVNQVPVNYFGRELKFAGNRIFPEWTVTIINDENFKVRSAFEVWMNGLNSHRGNLRSMLMKNSADYQRDGHVVQYGKRGEILKAYKFIGMFPTEVSPIDLDWSANDAFEEYAVTFAYQWWEQIPGDLSAERNVPVY